MYVVRFRYKTLKVTQGHHPVNTKHLNNVGPALYKWYTNGLCLLGRGHCQGGSDDSQNA